MGRPSTLTDAYGDLAGYSPPTDWLSGVQYDYAGRLTNITYLTGPFTYGGPTAASETRSYNVNGQLASINWGNTPNAISGVQYVYSATQNNGQITQEKDTFYSGSDVNTASYQYDALKRLTSAVSAHTVGTYGTPYTETFQYDGFGNPKVTFQSICRNSSALPKLALFGFVISQNRLQTPFRQSRSKPYRF